MVVFDTEVVDLTDDLDDPVDVLFGVQLGGGTDINRALAYCESVIERPADTVLVLISDLYEGGIAEEMLTRAASLVGSGVTVVALPVGGVRSIRTVPKLTVAALPALSRAVPVTSTPTGAVSAETVHVPTTETPPAAGPPFTPAPDVLLPAQPPATAADPRRAW